MFKISGDYHIKIFRSFNPIQIGFLGVTGEGEGGKKAPVPKNCRTYPTMI